MSQRVVTLSLAAAVALCLLLVGSVLPVPYVALGPGPSSDTLGSVGGEPLITITGRETFPTRGELDLLTVGVDPTLQLGEAVLDWLDPERAVVPREQVYPPGKSVREVQREDEQAMRDSQTSATTAALRHLGIPVTTTVTVGSVTEDGPARASLQPGDVLTTVDGRPVTSAEELRRLIGERRPGDRVTIGLTRGGTATSVELTTAAAPDDPRRPVIGVVTRLTATYPFTVEIRLEDVGGPSAGLMFALGIIEKLTPGELTGGRVVAGTGAITDTGDVLPIGGIRQKLLAAEEERADVFLVPAANCEELGDRAPASMRVLRVATLDEAVRGLDQIRTGNGTPPSC